MYKDGAVAEEDLDPSLISDRLVEKDTLVWLDLEDPSDEELSMIQEEFSLHPLAIEDARHRDQRPKVEIFADHFFVVMHSMRPDGEELQDTEVHAFVGPGFLVTLRYPPAFDLTRVLERWESQSELTKQGGGFLLYALLDEVVDGYFDVLERFEDLSEEVEQQVFANHPPSDVQERIFDLKKQVLRFRRRVMPLRDALDLLQEEKGVVTEPLRAYYRDVADHLIRTLEFVDNIRELLTTALEAHLSQVSNRLNQVMKQVTSWAAIILVPTLIAGIYGMNFVHMPELDWLFGYAFALGLMVVTAIGLFVMFRRRDWL